MIVEGVAKLSGEFSARVGDAGHGQMFLSETTLGRSALWVQYRMASPTFGPPWRAGKPGSQMCGPADRAAPSFRDRCNMDSQHFSYAS